MCACWDAVYWPCHAGKPAFSGNAANAFQRINTKAPICFRPFIQRTQQVETCSGSTPLAGLPWGSAWGKGESAALVSGWADIGPASPDSYIAQTVLSWIGLYCRRRSSTHQV